MKEAIKRSGLPVDSFFSTNGKMYKELGLKEKLSSMSEEEKLQLLASDGALVKRPLLIADDFVLIDFKEAEYNEKFAK